MPPIDFPAHESLGSDHSKDQLTDLELRASWLAAGGSFHGPNIETATMPVALLLRFLREIHGGSVVDPPPSDAERHAARAALRLAIGKCGSQAAFARVLSNRMRMAISAQRVWNWLNRDDGAPAEVCPTIEVITGIPCEQLRPNVDWASLRGGWSSSSTRDFPSLRQVHKR